MADAKQPAKKPAEDPRKPYTVLAENHYHGGDPAPKGATIHLTDDQAERLGDKVKPA